jgi:hypothetical protein
MNFRHNIMNVLEFKRIESKECILCDKSASLLKLIKFPSLNQTI